jgi:UDPglucose 6-dehydrogenase
MEQARNLVTDVAFMADPYDCIEKADVLVIVTEWDAFRALDLSRVRAGMNTPVLVDLRNIYEPEEAVRHGFSYWSVGRATV